MGNFISSLVETVASAWQSIINFTVEIFSSIGRYAIEMSKAIVREVTVYFYKLFESGSLVKEFVSKIKLDFNQVKEQKIDDLLKVS